MTETEKIIEDFKSKYGSKIMKEKSIYNYSINNHRRFNWLFIQICTRLQGSGCYDKDGKD